MLTLDRLQALARDHESTKVLSIYVDSRVSDPALRHAWRARLDAAVRAARADIHEPRELENFDRAASLLDAPGSPLETVRGAPGWVAFIAPERVLLAEVLPVRVPTDARWREGPLISPCVRVLKQHRPVIVALVESGRARLFRYAWGALSDPEMLSAEPETVADASHPDHGSRGMATAAPRSALDTEQARERRRAHFRRLTTAIVRRARELAGPDGWILVGGTTEWARAAAGAFPTSLARRVLLSDTLDHRASEREIADAAREAASDLRARNGRMLLDQLAETAGAGGRGALGIPAVQRALRGRAVGQLILTPEFLRRNAALGEESVRQALASGALVEVLSGYAAEQLDRTSNGIAARLRYPIDAAPLFSASGAGDLAPTPTAVMEAR